MTIKEINRLPRRFKVDGNILEAKNAFAGTVYIQRQFFDGDPGEWLKIGSLTSGQGKMTLPKELSNGYYFIRCDSKVIDGIYIGKKPKAHWTAAPYTEHENKENDVYRHRISFPKDMKVTYGKDFRLYRGKTSVTLPGSIGIRVSEFDFLYAADRKGFQLKMEEELSVFVDLD